MQGVPVGEKLFIGGDFNIHVGVNVGVNSLIGEGMRNSIVVFGIW